MSLLYHEHMYVFKWHIVDSEVIENLPRASRPPISIIDD